MITTKQIDDIIEVVLERTEMMSTGPDEIYVHITASDRKEIISIIRDIIGEQK